ncbi:receptor-like protein 12 isoform X1 [Gossypium australe]|uniref:Receptor-like protein 12 isoform X1 n=1 Tax=Gossypium australe TaxID=47621 RepID=A0A5B6VTB4_9ROSI|nr:receptor-like protein 12 isoform X1 [Gossypium australe]
MICFIPTPNFMAKTIFLPFLMFALLVIFGAILSVNSLNITIDQLNLLALKSYISHDPRNLLVTNWSTSTSVCNWIGVTCGSRYHRVISLNLSNMDLTGTIPSQLGNLSFLTSLNIHNNNFHGPLPIELTKLHRLKYLNFNNNSFDGELPSWFGYFPKLQSLSLSDNYFIGVVPSILGFLPQSLTFFHCNCNIFHCNTKIFWLSVFEYGEISSVIENLTSLLYIDLSYNNLSGGLPSRVFDNFSKLQVLNLGWNRIFGKIPSSLFKCKELTYLSLYNNTLEGSIPREIENLTSLEILYLDHNNLKGEIPFVIGKLTSLVIIDFSFNNLTGEIPVVIGNMTSLERMYFSGNKLTGRIPTPPPSLLWYFVSRNKLVGDIPSSICNSSSLEVLTLWNNSFNGTIPECIGNLKSFGRDCTLQSFRITNNQIGGSLPRSLGNCKNLNLLDVGNNNLNDTFPNWLGKLDHLQVLVLRSNKFFGQMDNSDVTVSFTRLRVIDLSRNNFSGYLPTNFFKNLHSIRKGHENKLEPEYMEDVSDYIAFNYAYGLSFTVKGSELQFQSLSTMWMVIDFSDNQFFGELPRTLGELHSLIVLNLSHNCLTGPIPSSLGDLSELESLDLSSNKFQGRIPTEGTLVKFDRDDDELNWKFSILMGYGCGLVLGLSMGYIVFTTGKPGWLIRIVERVQQRFTKR